MFMRLSRARTLRGASASRRKPKKRVEMTLESTLQSVDRAEEIAVRFAEQAGFNEEDSQRVGMAVRESVANAVLHGNRYDPGKKVALRLEWEQEKLVATVTDQGYGFDMGKVPDPLSHENLLRQSGRGIFLIRAFMDEFRVRRLQPAGTEIRMIKHASAKNGKEE